MSEGELEVEVDNSIFKWTINLDSFYSETAGHKIVSPKLYGFDLELGKHEWQLESYFFGNTTSKKEDHLSLYLRHLNENDICIAYTLSILDQDNMVVGTNGKFNRLFSNSGKCWGWAKFAALSLINDTNNNILKNNKLSVLCKIIYKKNSEIIDTKCFNENNSNRLTHLDNFEELLANQEFSDVTITAEKKNFYLHKCILALHSPVFKAMFSNDMKEKNQGIVEIEDIKYNVLEELFQFIYTGKVNKIDVKVCDLLIAAEKYDVKGLKILCEETMSKSLNFKNAIRYLNLAILNNANKLKTDAIEFIALWLEDMVKTPYFNELKDINLLQKIMKKHFSIGEMKFSVFE